MKILVVEDDDAFIKLLTSTLKAQHYSVDSVQDGETGWNYGSTFDYDLMLIDVMLPEVDGISLCKRFRAAGYTTPILLLTAQDTNTTKVQGLDAGADDYVVKPFDSAELLARIRALLRRNSSNPMPLLAWGDLMLNPSTCDVQYQGRDLTLTGKEYELLELMLRDSQHVFSVEELLEHLWSSDDFPSEATVRSHIRRVRQKLVAGGAPSDFIATLHGRGYYLKPMPSDDAIYAAASSLRPGGSGVGQEVAGSGEEEAAIATPADLSNPQQEYLQFLNQTWAETQPKSLAQVAQLQQILQQLATEQEPIHQQENRDSAQQLAHKLAGTLSVFGCQQAVQLARQLESALSQSEVLSVQQFPAMLLWVEELQRAIQTTQQIQASQLPQDPMPHLLLVTVDQRFSQALQAQAACFGVQIQCIVPHDLDSADVPADFVLLRLSDTQRQGSTPSLHKCLQQLERGYPDVPVLVMSDRLGLRDRLSLARQEGRYFLDWTTSPSDSLTTALKLLQDNRQATHQATKVMVVDDDIAWLGSLPRLLKPWGFNVTTLADPQQFWVVLQTVMPDVLVLDIKMPEINGFELCQILRSDPHWQHLPVLFLSVLTDAPSEQRAFKVGADDYLCKPLQGGDLANRIRHRLRRMRAYPG